MYVRTYRTSFRIAAERNPPCVLRENVARLMAARTSCERQQPLRRTFPKSHAIPPRFDRGSDQIASPEAKSLSCQDASRVVTIELKSAHGNSSGEDIPQVRQGE